MRPLAVVARTLYVALVILGMVLLAGCDRAVSTVTAKRSTSSACPQVGQLVLAQICAVELSDVTFRFQLSGSTKEGNHYAGSGTGTATNDPQRFQFSVTVLNGGTTFAWDEIDDVATNSSYQHDSQPASMASASWDKLRLTDDAFMVEQTLDYRKLENAMLVGMDQIMGISVWHARASATEEPNQAQMDVYVRKDDFLPIRLVLNIVDPVSRTGITYNFTSINTGLTISLPSPDQVRSP
jgi:hypothetical protein